MNILLLIVVLALACILLLAAVFARRTLAPQAADWRDCTVERDSVVTHVYHSTYTSDDLECDADEAMRRGDVARARLLRDLAEAQNVRDRVRRTELRWQREHPPVRVRQHGVRGLEA